MSPQLDMETVKAKIREAGDLPTLPTIAAEVMQLVGSPDSSMAEVSKVIHNDPSLASRVLKIANSALYGSTGQIDSIQRALVVLGMKEVGTIVTSVGVFGTFPEKPGVKAFDRVAFWEHSAAVAAISKLMCEKLKIIMAGREFLAGLFHDVGKILLDHFFHDTFTEAYQHALDRDLTMREAESEVLGVTHTEIGGWLGGEWKLPESIAEAISFHHDPDQAQVDPLLVSITHLSNLFAMAGGIGFGSGLNGIDLEDDPAWGVLAKERPDLENLDIARFIFELEDQMEDIREIVRVGRG